MYIVRDTFNAKPGQAKNLIEKFQAALPDFRREGVRGLRILVDSVSDYWTVVLEIEVEDLGMYFAMAENPAGREKLAGYLDYVLGGKREIFRIVAEG